MPGRDSNPRALDRESDTLPTAPRRHRKGAITFTGESFKEDAMKPRIVQRPVTNV